MDTWVSKPTERRRRRHAEEFKRQVVEACLQPGVSVAAIALANGLNANYLRRWVREHREATAVALCNETPCEITAPETPAMILATTRAEPEAMPPPREIRLDVRRGGTTVQMAWPLDAVAGLGQCLRELLR